MAVAAIFLLACNNKTTTATTTGSDSTTIYLEKIKLAALQSDSAFVKKDVDGSMKDYAPGFLEYGSGASKPMTNMDSVKADAKNFFVAFPDFKGENFHAIASDSTVVILGDWSGTFKSDYMKMKATGKSFKVADADIFTFNKAGKATSHRSIQSLASFLTQLGVPMPAKKK